jgi:hypothetical protein
LDEKRVERILSFGETNEDVEDAAGKRARKVLELEDEGENGGTLLQTREVHRYAREEGILSLSHPIHSLLSQTRSRDSEACSLD